MENVEQEVLEVERSFWEHAAEPGFFDSALSEDSLSIIASAGFITKEEAIKINGDARPWRDVRMEDVHTIRLTEDCVAVAYRGSAIREGDDDRYEATISSVYVRRDGRWLLALTTHMPG